MGARLKVALLAGGKSGEREVSLKGAEGVQQALDRNRYDVRRYDPAFDLAKLAAEASEIDVAFILLHGRFGEDGTVQGFLDLLGIPYQGAGVLGSALAMDKHVAKVMYRQAGLPVPDWELVDPRRPDPAGLVARLGLPLVVKPLRQGSSLGMSIVDSLTELNGGLQKAFEFDDRVMVEKFVAGREITGGVLGNGDELTALPLVEIIPDKQFRFFDYQAKYQPGASREVCPAELDEKTTQLAQSYALAAHRALQLDVYSRTDMIVGAEGLYLLETNTIPGMTPTSLLPQAAKAYGLDFPAFLDRLIELALQKGKR
ncbi:MAG TPA: D-alanine--D-alanine ligase [Desulfurivibrionaceae bacterium]|nr:D-alanine--D-alanine ligase [Desulfurivibrionaceae bacterium]